MPSGYFGIPGPLRPVANVLKQAAQRAFRATILNKATRQLRAQPARASAGDRQKARKLYSSISVQQAKQVHQAFKHSDFGKFVDQIERYSKANGSQSINTFLQSLGSLGKVVSVIIGSTQNVLKPHTRVGRELRTALDFVGSFADQPNVLEALQRILEGQGAKVSWGPGYKTNPKEDKKIGKKLGSLARKHEKQEEAKQRKLGKRQTVDVDMGGSGVGPPNLKRFGREHPLVTGDMVQTPSSSNVYSFGYDLSTHILYVRFKAPSKQVPRPHAPGPIYAFYNTPPELFLAMFKASSRGKFVWDKLRIRGTVSGHQYDYSLVGVQDGYVPRKATMTPKGEAYIPRSVYTDENRTRTSAKGYELVRPMMPMPKTGAPNTGRPKGPRTGQP